MAESGYPSAPPPEPSTIDLMRQVSTFQMQRTGITPSAREILGNALDDYQNRVRLALAVYGTHRMRRLSSIMGATDQMEERLRDPAYLDALARRNPVEFRKTYEILKGVERDDIEFLRAQSAETAEREGFSRDPKAQFKLFFEQSFLGAVQNLDVDERRRTKQFIEELFDMVTQTRSAPPLPRSRVLEGQPPPLQLPLPPGLPEGEHGGNGTATK